MEEVCKPQQVEAIPKDLNSLEKPVPSAKEILSQKKNKIGKKEIDLKTFGSFILNVKKKHVMSDDFFEYPKCKKIYKSHYGNNFYWKTMLKSVLIKLFVIQSQLRCCKYLRFYRICRKISTGKRIVNFQYFRM